MKKIFYSPKNGRPFQLISLLTIFFMINIQVATLHPMFTVKPKPYKRLSKTPKKRGLLIFLDEVEKHMTEAVGEDLINGLYQAENPIIVSYSLMCNLLEYRERDKRSVSVLMVERGKLKNAEYLDWFKEKYGASWLDEIYRKEAVIHCKIAFKPEQWIIKEINNSLLLLIPYKYCDSLGVNGESVKEYTNISNDIELKMGFRVNHMKTLEYTSIYRSSLKKYFYQYIIGIDSSAIFRFADYFVNSLDTIFCKKSDYNMRNSIITEWNDYKSKNIPIPEWIIYIMGHGLKNDSIANMSLNDFKQFLMFLENKIKTGLLFMVSCQVAGVNVNQIYGELKSGTQQYYSFPIILQGLSDAITFSRRPKIDLDAFWRSKNNDVLLNQGFNKWLESGDLKLQIKDFAEFFKRANEEEGDYRKIVEPLIDQSSVTNELQIKMPGVEWFSLIDTKNKIVSIGSILAKTRDPQKPLDITSFFKKQPEIILLYTDNIPFELMIDVASVKAIVSMVSPGLAESYSARVIQKIKKISTSKLESLENILNLFASVAYTNGAKWFFVEEIDNGQEIWKDVLIDGTYKDGVTAYLKDGYNFLHKLNIINKEQEDAKIVQKGSYDERSYNERMDIVRHQYSEPSEKIAPQNEGTIFGLLQKRFWPQEYIQKKEISDEHIKNIKNIFMRHPQEVLKRKQKELENELEKKRERKRERERILIE